MVHTLEAACGSYIGVGRIKNEDNFYFNKKHLPQDNKGLKHPIKCSIDTSELSVFAVFDGMGGHTAGDMASLLASEILSDDMKKSEDLVVNEKIFFSEFCKHANDKIVELSNKLQAVTTGTTVAALSFSQEDVVLCNVGDSKVFRIRDSQMLQISNDHTDEKIMQSMGINKKPVLLQYLGMPEKDMMIDPYISRGSVKSGDVFVICSDGVTDALSFAEIFRFIEGSDTPENAVISILSEVELKCGNDNSTIIIIKVV